MSTDHSDREAAGPQHPGRDADVDTRLAALEEQVARLRERSEDDDAPARAPRASADTTGEDPFWALTALEERQPDPGAVVYAGSVTTGAGHVKYQWGRPTEHLLAADWAQHAETVGSLGHPLRLALLRRLLNGERTVAQLVDELELGSTGVAYHHLHALQGGGWVTSPRRGTWSLPPSRIVPLLTILVALENG